MKTVALAMPEDTKALGFLLNRAGYIKKVWSGTELSSALKKEPEIDVLALSEGLTISDLGLNNLAEIVLYLRYEASAKWNEIPVVVLCLGSEKIVIKEHPGLDWDQLGCCLLSMLHLLGKWRDIESLNRVTNLPETKKFAAFNRERAQRLVNGLLHSLKTNFFYNCKYAREFSDDTETYKKFLDAFNDPYKWRKKKDDLDELLNRIKIMGLDKKAFPSLETLKQEFNKLNGMNFPDEYLDDKVKKQSVRKKIDQCKEFFEKYSRSSL